MFTLEMLPADEGDALWIEYGSQPGEVNRILIDCGRKTAYRAVAERLGGDADISFELFVLTHVDADHIAGAVPLLQDERFGPDRVGDVWFNGWRHLNGWHKDEEPNTGPDVLSAKQGEYFGAVLRDAKYPWNVAFDGHGAVVDDGSYRELPTLPGGMRLTLLGPTQSKLDAMRRFWQKDLSRASSAGELQPGDWERALEMLSADRRHGPDVLGSVPSGPIQIKKLLAVPFKADTKEPNGSSICLLAEYGDEAVLLTGDAHAPALATSIKRLLADRGKDRLELSAMKLAHHGSKANNSLELLDLLDCRRFLVSTNGKRHHHPDREALARVVTHRDERIEVVFNFETPLTDVWAKDNLPETHNYVPKYPDGSPGILVDLEAPISD